MKKLMLSTAILALAGTPLLAQENDAMFREAPGATELHASNLIGMRVYRSETADAEGYESVQGDWDDIGEVNDIVLSRDGNVEAVLIDIGGFLGMGENQVAVDMDALRFASDTSTAEDDSDFFLVLNTPRQSLEEAPTYQRMSAGQAQEGMDDEMSDQTAQTDQTDMTDETDMADQTGAADQTDMTGETDMAAADDGTAQAEAEVYGDEATGSTVMREGYRTAAEADLTADNLTGAAAYDATDERIGEVSELLLTEEGKITAVVVDVGGFLGIGEKPVKLDLSEVDILHADDGSDVRVYLAHSEEELEAMPDYE